MTGAPLTIACQVRRIIADELGLDPDMLASTDRLDALGATDIARIHIGMSVEDLVDAEAPDEAHEACKTVGDIIALAERLAAGSAVAA